MINTTANIYLSLGQSLRGGNDDSHGYRRQKHTYLISVEPHRCHVLGTPHREASLTHFEAVKDSVTGNHVLAKYTSKDSPGIIGNILIAESSHTTVDKVYRVLSEQLATAASSMDTGDSYADDENEHWTKGFIHALQKQGVIINFKIDEFILWVHSYLVDRLDNEAPALIAYPRAHKDHAQKASGRKSQII